MFLALIRLADLKVAREDGIGRREDGAQEEAAAERHGAECPAEGCDGENGQRHGDGEQAEGRPPAFEIHKLVDSQADAEQADDHAELTDDFPRQRNGERVEGRGRSGGPAEDDKAQPDQQACSRWLARRKQARQPVGEQDRKAQADEQQVIAGKFVHAGSTPRT